MKPGTIHWPRASTSVAPAGIGTLRLGPAATIREPERTTTASAIAAPPFPSTSVAPTIAVVGAACADNRRHINPAAANAIHVFGITMCAIPFMNRRSVRLQADVTVRLKPDATFEGLESKVRWSILGGRMKKAMLMAVLGAVLVPALAAAQAQKTVNVNEIVELELMTTSEAYDKIHN